MGINVSDFEKFKDEIDKLAKEAKEWAEYLLHDQFSESDFDTDENRKYHAIEHMRRLLFEKIIEESKYEEDIAHFFDNVYYQIAARHAGPEDFNKKASPYFLPTEGGKSRSNTPNIFYKGDNN